jgi:nicotinamidase-related amidase
MADSDHEAVLDIVAMKAAAPLELPAAAIALLVIDMQRYFVEADGRFATLADALSSGASDNYRQRVAEQVLPNVVRLVAAFREGGLPVFFTGTGTRTGDGEDLAGWLRAFDQVSRAALGAPVWPKTDDADWQIDAALAPQPGEPVLQKTTADPFVSTDLDERLRSRGIRAVVVCGLTSDVCVAATARGAADRDYQAVVVEDACTTLSEQLHRASLDIIGLAFGRIARTEDIVKRIRAPVEVTLGPAPAA